MWLQKIFEREFGFSDVQSNYSRVYSWMANQLGHMTLGMATAFFFVWTAETVRSTAILIVDWSARPTKAAGDCELAVACFANNALLFLATTVILAAISTICFLGVWRQADPTPEDEARRYRAVPPRARQSIHGVFFGLMAIALTYLLYKAAVEPDLAQRERYLAHLSVAAACFAVGAGVLKLCRDFRWFVFALLAIFGAFWIGTGGAGATEEPRRWVAVALSALFFIYGCASTAIGKGVPEKLPGPERVVQFATILILSAWFISGTWNGLEGEWPLAIAAGIASCALWWVKEFGSDLPNVHKEIATAARRRPKGVLGDCSAVDRDYFDDARMDARTDGLFYFAGAWIGVGVLSDTPVMTKTSWESGSEVLGLLVFLFIFLVVGKNWAFRQQALDFAGMTSASRLAVFRSALKMVVVPKDQELAMGRPPEESPALAYVDETLQVLRAFAHESWDDETGAHEFQHLIVFGAVGSGRTPLGRALASEAALSDLPTLADRLALFREDRSPRTGRMMTTPRLRFYWEDVKRKEDVHAVPPMPMWIRPNGQVTRATAKAPPEGHEALRPASLVVIDDVVLPGAHPPRSLVANLAINDGFLSEKQRTVWLIDDSRFGGIGSASQEEINGWAPDYRRVEDELAAVRAALTVDGDAPTIAVAFTRRFELFDELPARP